MWVIPEASAAFVCQLEQVLDVYQRPYAAPYPVVKNLYELGQQSTTEIMSSFQIGSRRTFYKVLRHAGVIIKPMNHSRRKGD